MNAVETEEAVANLALQPLDVEAFPFDFLAAFGNRNTSRKRLRRGHTPTCQLHLKVCTSVVGAGDTLKALRDSPKTVGAKA